MQMSTEDDFNRILSPQTPKHVSADVIDSEGHQRISPDQTYDIICHKTYKSTGMFGLSLTFVSTELFD
jgi:hypothetical protein